MEIIIRALEILAYICGFLIVFYGFIKHINNRR